MMIEQLEAAEELLVAAGQQGCEMAGAKKPVPSEAPEDSSIALRERHRRDLFGTAETGESAHQPSFYHGKHPWRTTLFSLFGRVLGLFDERPKLDVHCVSNSQKSVQGGPAEFVFNAAYHRMGQLGAFRDLIHGQTQGFAFLAQ